MAEAGVLGPAVVVTRNGRDACGRGASRRTWRLRLMHLRMGLGGAVGPGRAALVWREQPHLHSHSDKRGSMLDRIRLAPRLAASPLSTLAADPFLRSAV